MTPPESESGQPENPRRVVSRQDIAQIAGDVSDVTAAAIEACGATQADLEQAVAWISGDDDGLHRMRHHPSGVVARLCEILAREGDLDEEGGPEPT